jgi:murein DD-endopeptidase MepM/ murein hydrolase activator NlpD
MAKLELFYPVKPLGFNQKFGNVLPVYTAMGMKGHNGIDFQAFHGQPIHASHDGVCFPEIDNHGGNGVVIRTNEAFDYTADGAPVSGQAFFKTIYWHMIDANAVVKTGQVVKAGDLIGYADNTGTSTGDHLHFGLKPQAYNESNFSWYNVDQTNGFLGCIDPEPYFNGFFAEDAQKVLSTYQQIIALLKKILGLK